MKRKRNPIEWADLFVLSVPLSPGVFATLAFIFAR